MKIPYILLLDAYIEQVLRGIRDITQPNVAIDNLSYAIKMKKYIKEKGLECEIVLEHFRDKESNIIVETQYSLLIYKPKSKDDVEELKNLLAKINKTSYDHRRIGELFHYSREAIQEFIDR